MKTFSTLTGILFFLQVVVGAYLLWGGAPMVLLDPTAWLFILLVPYGPALMAYGLENTWHGVASLKYLFVTPPLSVKNFSGRIMVVDGFIKTTYAGAQIGMIFGIIITMAHIAGKPEEVGHHVAASFVILVYGVIAAEGIWRPLRNRLEALQDNAIAHAYPGEVIVISSENVGSGSPQV